MKITKNQFQELLDKYLSGQASAEERKLLDHFFDSYKSTAVDHQDLHAEVKEEILQHIQAKTGSNGRHISRSGFTFSPWLRVAAVISFALITSYFIFYRVGLREEVTTQYSAKIKEVAASKGQKLDLRLPDGSRVKLNANSKITYPEKFDSETREVTLEGEAYFEVTHMPSRPFVVRTSDVSTQVLGTSFNVLAVGETTAITLVDGKVNVTLSNGASATLVPNFQAIIPRGSEQIVTQEVDVEQYVGWKDNTLHFNNTTVREAFAALENWYNVDIEAKSPTLLDCVITSKYKNESLENVLNSFRFMLKMDFKIDGQHVTVSGNGCP